MDRLLCVIIGYVFGMFQTSYIYGRLRGIDIREHGSGNAGATNAQRTLGNKAGAITLIGDCLKCILAVLLTRALFAGAYSGENMGIVLGMYTAAGVILGHNFPFYLQFHGGKGISATAGIFATLDPVIAAIALVIFLISVAATRYVSLGSILVSVWLGVSVIWYCLADKWTLAQGHMCELIVVTLFICVMNIYRHKHNIVQLLNGTERKIGQHAD